MAKTLLTGAALAVTAYTRVLGKKIDLASSEKTESEEITEAVPVGPGQAERQLAWMQWALPALTGGLVVLNALHGEQQRPSQQSGGPLRGAFARMRGEQ
ncbi:hypothetical protein GCM10010329_30660 [Streptomyces spiroverticillatus]|uniref:Uncharacterized protein n=1 Tax=Streptomyces finlayi TaxID=67296 RepID=A0A918WW83_9ACTN|nr:hypothetical protein GCM10010329_30660 [Streptomyces spiroverticillatus]GHC89689.1 hypothetical protein GCM10010334_23070 [Streptomyces finlayi]